MFNDIGDGNCTGIRNERYSSICKINIVNIAHMPEILNWFWVKSTPLPSFQHFQKLCYVVPLKTVDVTQILTYMEEKSYVVTSTPKLFPTW